MKTNTYKNEAAVSELLPPPAKNTENELISAMYTWHETVSKKINIARREHLVSFLADLGWTAARVKEKINADSLFLGLCKKFSCSVSTGNAIPMDYTRLFFPDFKPAQKNDNIYLHERDGLDCAR